MSLPPTSSPSERLLVPATPAVVPRRGGGLSSGLLSAAQVLQLVRLPHGGSGRQRRLSKLWFEKGEWCERFRDQSVLSIDQRPLTHMHAGPRRDTNCCGSLVLVERCGMRPSLGSM